MGDLPISLPDATWRQKFRRRLRAWYHRHARDLPWRRTRDPYAIWLSEVMLQQTQVATVKPYYERFLAALPTIEALAQTDEQEVLRLWEGLGYYRRARQLHQAARIILADHGGRFPRDPKTARLLPGIGRYTAGAVLSIAFDACEPILEANTIRLLSRLLAYTGNPASTVGQKVLWAMVKAVLPRGQVGKFNQALMELGSEVCQLRQPRCRQCPVSDLCAANLRGLQPQIPAVTRKTRPEAVREAAVIVERRGRVLVLRWPEGRRWAGLWDFPRFPIHAQQPAALRGELAEEVRRLTGAVVAPGQRFATLSHRVTRFRITLDCHRAEYLSQADGQAGAEAMETRWLRPVELANYPLSSTGRWLARRLLSC